MKTEMYFGLKLNLFLINSDLNNWDELTSLFKISKFPLEHAIVADHSRHHYFLLLRF